MLAMLSLHELPIVLVVAGILLVVAAAGGVIIYATMRRGARDSARAAGPLEAAAPDETAPP